jgi:hypothetical protein
MFLKRFVLKARTRIKKNHRSCFLLLARKVFSKLSLIPSSNAAVVEPKLVDGDDQSCGVKADGHPAVVSALRRRVLQGLLEVLGRRDSRFVDVKVFYEGQVSTAQGEGHYD